MHAVQGGLLGVIRALQSEINICYPPSPHLPTEKVKICQAELQLVFTFDNWFTSFGQLSGTGRPLKLLAPSVLQPATSQARLHGVRGQTSMYVCQSFQ
jgi:hypothetical protein